MTRPVTFACAVVAVSLACLSPAARAGADLGLYRPQVPVSAFARPSAWLDPSRLRVSTEVSVGSGFGGGAQGLQVTRFSYQLGAPLAMSVSLGNAFGSGLRGGSGMFLEGLDLSYRPSSSTLVQFRYQDLRSPLQLSRYGLGSDPYGFWR